MAASSRPNDYERSDAEPRLIAWIAIGLAVFVAITPLVMRAFYPSTTRQTEVAALPRPPQPSLEVMPRKSLAALHAREDAALSGYGWADRTHGVVRIPIDRAATLLSERGWPPAAADMK